MKNAYTITQRSLQLAFAVAAFSFDTSAQSLNNSGGVNLSQTKMHVGK